MNQPPPSRPLGAGLIHRLRRPGRVDGDHQKYYAPGVLGDRCIRFAGALVPRPLPDTQPSSSGPAPGRTLAGATRTEVPVHRLAPVQAAGSMVVPRDLMPLQPPVGEPHS